MHLTGDDPVAAITDAAPEREGSWETPQRSGFWCVGAFLKEAERALGPARPHPPALQLRALCADGRPLRDRTRPRVAGTGREARHARAAPRGAPGRGR